MHMRLAIDHSPNAHTWVSIFVANAPLRLITQRKGYRFAMGLTELEYDWFRRMVSAWLKMLARHSISLFCIFGVLTGSMSPFSCFCCFFSVVSAVPNDQGTQSERVGRYICEMFFCLRLCLPYHRVVADVRKLLLTQVCFIFPSGLHILCPSHFSFYCSISEGLPNI
ncbi:hypothetical protein L211DRAFT_475709 [Terfezia boudieri ATCC MYA-4762]|uniref:Uncharacterized protein n=1 Tax=Terfezia boudieri ATCC MYA-4762 TaxID=1051890 RepID=A0A3N4LYJ5_9PEZI|nr:hypothetical protein L211DRAFT_475709 [Terfezia boudieri ATCC MYA-4762]